MKAKLTGTSSILIVKDVTISAEYYRDKLGFTIIELQTKPNGFAMVKRNEFILMFVNAPPEKITPNWKIVDKTSNVYFWVDDAETLYKEFIDNGANIDYSLYNTPYGMKEFGISDPDEYDISFGEILK
jgi:uncharacterized glyoxalase superfamily protein PhnB